MVRKIVYMVLQIGVLYLFYYIGLWIQRTFHLLIPGSIVGMLLLFGLLLTKKFKLSWIDQGSHFLLSHLSLLFVPITVGIMQYPELFKGEGLYSIFVVIISTIIVMATSAYISQSIAVRQNKQLPMQTEEKERL